MDGLLGEPECNEQRRVVALATQPPGGLFLGTFSWPRKKKYLALGGETPIKTSFAEGDTKPAFWELSHPP